MIDIPLLFALSRDNHIEAGAERAEFSGNAVPRLAAHDDCVAHRVRRRGGRGLFEKRHVAGQAPRQLARAANAAVGRGGDDDREASHGCRVARTLQRSTRLKKWREAETKIRNLYARPPTLLRRFFHEQHLSAFPLFACFHLPPRQTLPLRAIATPLCSTGRASLLPTMSLQHYMRPKRVPKCFPAAPPSHRRRHPRPRRLSPRAALRTDSEFIRGQV